MSSNVFMLQNISGRKRAKKKFEQSEIKIMLEIKTLIKEKTADPQILKGKIYMERPDAKI